jgi:hypothetical protein
MMSDAESLVSRSRDRRRRESQLPPQGGEAAPPPAEGSPPPRRGHRRSAHRPQGEDSPDIYGRTPLLIGGAPTSPRAAARAYISLLDGTPTTPRLGSAPATSRSKAPKPASKAPKPASKSAARAKAKAAAKVAAADESAVREAERQVQLSDLVAKKIHEGDCPFESFSTRARALAADGATKVAAADESAGREAERRARALADHGKFTKEARRKLAQQARQAEVVREHEISTPACESSPGRITGSVARRVSHERADANQQIEDTTKQLLSRAHPGGGAESVAERRVAPDGAAYTRGEFRQFFGEVSCEAEWAAAEWALGPGAPMMEPRPPPEKGWADGGLNGTNCDNRVDHKAPWPWPWTLDYNGGRDISNADMLRVMAAARPRSPTPEQKAGHTIYGVPLTELRQFPPPDRIARERYLA